MIQQNYFQILYLAKFLAYFNKLSFPYMFNFYYKFCF